MTHMTIIKITITKPKDLTIEEIREHMSLYQRLYHHKMKDTPEYQDAKRQSKRKHYLKKRQGVRSKGSWNKD